MSSEYIPAVKPTDPLEILKLCEEALNTEFADNKGLEHLRKVFTDEEIGKLCVLKPIFYKDSNDSFIRGAAGGNYLYC